MMISIACWGEAKNYISLSTAGTTKRLFGLFKEKERNLFGEYNYSSTNGILFNILR